MKLFFKILILWFFPVISIHAVQENPTQKFKDSIQFEITKLSDSLKAQKYYNASFYALQRLNNLKLSRLYADSSMHYAKISGFKDSEAKSHFQFGLLERIEGNYEKALSHLESNIQYFKNDSTLMAYSLFQVGVIYKTLGDYAKSLKTYITILEIFEKKKDSFAMASTLNSIGNIYGDMGKPNEAIKNYSNALKIFEVKKSDRDISNSYENMGKMYALKGDIIAARASIQKALNIAKNTKEDFQIAKTLYALGKTYLDSNLNEAFKYFDASAKLFESKNYQKELIPVYRDMGCFYKEKSNYTKAIEFYTKSLKLAKEFKEQPYVKDAYKGLFETHESLKNYDEAFKYQSKYTEIKDSLFNSENLKTINLLQKQFETKKKDNEITFQKLKLEHQQNQLQKKKIEYSYMTGIAIFLLLMSLLTWFLYKQRQKRKDQEILTLKREHQIKTLESLIEGEEKERFRIAKELHDGVNGDLSAIKYKLTALLEKNNSVINEAVAMIDKSCEQVRAISHNLIPPSLKNFSLLEALEDYCSTMNGIHKPEITFQHLGDGIVISKKAEVNIFRIIQELINNSIKYADATEIDVQISNRDHVVQITVEDNGKGFNVNDASEKGIGLKNIQSRVDYLKGKLDFSSTDEGSSFIIEINLNQLNDN